MYYALRAVVLVGIVAMLPVRAGAQGVVTQRTISLNMAKIIAEATLAECKSKGYNTAVAVVDRAGQVLVMMRDENGAVGSSGSTQEQDDACAKAGVAKVAELLKSNGPN